MPYQPNTAFFAHVYSPIPSFSFLKQLAVIRPDVFTRTVFLLRNFTVSVNLRHENLKEGPLMLSSVNSTLFLLDKIESIKQIFPWHLLCVWHYSGDRGDSSKQKTDMPAYTVIQAYVLMYCGSTLEETMTRMGRTSIGRVGRPGSSTDQAPPASPPL